MEVISLSLDTWEYMKKNKIIKQHKHIWKPFGDDAITSISEYTPSLEIQYIYHWYCKCGETKTTREGWNNYGF